MDPPDINRALQAGSALWALLAKLVPLAYRLAGLVRILGWASAIAGLVTLVATLVIAVPTTAAPVLAMIVWIAILAFPPIVLWLFHGALQDVLGLPDWLRTSPELARKHASELAALTLAARGDPSALPADGRARRRVGLRDLPRVGRLLLEAHRDLPEYGRALRLLNPFFLVLLVGALVGALVEIAVAGAAVLVALTVRLVL